MIRNVEFLDPAKKLVDEVVDWLCGDPERDTPFPGRVRTVEGAASLAHVMVVVPTAQSGRNLRLALARKRGNVLPPKVVMPNLLLAPKEARVATEAEELAVMAEVLANCDLASFPALFPKTPSERSTDWALRMAEMILGIQSILGERAMLMSEVKCDGDADRWRDLAAIEKSFLDALKTQGALPRSLARREAAKAGCREEGIEEIVLPACVDLTGAFEDYLKNSPQQITVLVHAAEADAKKFDEWGRPVECFKADLAPEMIEVAPTAIVEADEIARHFKKVNSDEAWPALAVCDSEMYPTLEGAFQNYFREDELVLRNPAQERLANSSLGRLFGAIVALAANGDYETFSTLARMGDVARWARGRLQATAAEIAEYVGALDAVQNAHLPRTLDAAIAAARAESTEAWRERERKAAAGLVRLAEAVKEELADPFGFVRHIFASVTLDEKSPGDRELIAAAGVVRELREACESPVVPKRFRRRLFARLLDRATYMLEPTAENVLATTGWLELAWCPDDEVVIAGFNEGCVPENVVGHPFVPDSLRSELGIATNAARERRDAFRFAEAVACRDKGAVTVFLHQMSGDKDVVKPSRLLFPGISDKELPALAMRLYAVTKGNDGAPSKENPKAWRLKLPIPPKGTVFRESISPTKLDGYLECPFNFYLRETFGERSDDRNQELDAMAFGNICHAALDEFAKAGPKDSTNPDEIAAFLEDAVRRQLQSFGTTLPAIVEIQGEAAIGRLRAFAPHQAARRRAGWRILESEQNFACRIKQCPTELRGKVDRIDRHETTGELQIIDYKTWRNADVSKHCSLQLPIYRAMVEASGKYDAAKAKSSRALYCILAERPEDVRFDEEHACHDGMQSEAEDQVVALLTGIARGIFYPPNGTGSNCAWKRDYAELIGEGPEESVDLDWLADQAARREVQQ